MRMRNLLTWIIAAALFCAGDLRPAHAANFTIQHFFSTYGSFTVPRTTTRLDFVIRGGSGQSPFGGSKGGRGGEVTLSLAYGHGYKAYDYMLVFPGPQGGQGGGVADAFKGGRFGYYHKSGGDGGYGGAGSGVYNATQGRWLLIAGGGGGGGGLYIEAGGHGGDAGHPGGNGHVFGQPVGAPGGAAGSPCSTPPGPPSLSVGEGGRGHDGTGVASGGGGGGGGGCDAGAGGGTKDSLPAGGGGGGNDYIYGEATNVFRGLAPAGPGSVLVSITTYEEPPPEIISPNKAIFVAGQPACFDVVGLGSPPPDVHVSGQFPEGTTFRVPLFSGMGEIRGTPTSASVGTYSISIAMQNDWGSASQTLTIDVVNPENAPPNANVCNP
jgi:hypothetical protein